MEEEIYEHQPVSPTGQYFTSSALSVSILAVLELETHIDECHVNHFMTLVRTLFLPSNSRFSSVMVTDKNGVKQWKPVTVNLEDHVKVPIFPKELTKEACDTYLQDYMSEMVMDQLPEHMPLWEIHIVTSPTSNAAGLVIFKFHHALGDGYSLMGALLSCLRRADDPSLSLTFPSIRSAYEQKNNMFTRLSNFLPVVLNTSLDFISSLLKSTVVVDDKSPIRSGTKGVEFHPITISTTTFSLNQIKRIKAKIGGTVNHIAIGTIFFGLRLYMKSVGKASDNACSTALVLMNTRGINGYQTLEEMKKLNTKSSWGNQFAFLPMLIPKTNDPENADPLNFVANTKNATKRSKNSLAVHLTGSLLEMIRKLRGPETAARYISSTLRNTSMAISSMIGPIEKTAIGSHPCNGMYFMVVNGPQSLTITMMSYMGNLRVAVGAEKDYIDHELLISCLDKAFQRINDATLAT